jgi:hypothetical protein
VRENEIVRDRERDGMKKRERKGEKGLHIFNNMCNI